MKKTKQKTNSKQIHAIGRLSSILVIMDMCIHVNTLLKRHFAPPLLLQTDRKHAYRHNIRLSSPVVPDVFEEVEGLL